MRRLAQRQLERRWAPTLLGAGALLAILILLEVVIERGIVSSFLIPRPSDVVASFPMLFTQEQLFLRFLTTATEVFSAACFAILLGVTAGWGLHRWQRARLAYTSWIVGLNAAPTLLLYPLFLVIFGRGTSTIVALGVISALPAIVLKTCEGLDATRQVLLNVGRSFGLSPTQQLWLIQIPSAVPTIFAGVRLGLIYATTSVVSIEFLISFGGLGQLVPDLADRYEIPALYGAIVFIVLASAALQFAVARIERWLRPV